MEKENRINIEDLAQAERAVSPTEAKEVRGGVKLEDLLITGYQISGSGESGLSSQPVKADDIVIAGPSQPHVK